MAAHKRETFWQNFRRFFLRGLAILLPSILTFWLLIAAYNFVDETIAEPINAGVRELVVRFTDYPEVTDKEAKDHVFEIEPSERKAWISSREKEAREIWKAASEANAKMVEEKAWPPNLTIDNSLRRMTQRDKLETIWRTSSWPLDLLGLFLAVMLIYLAGGFLGSFIGRRIYVRGERLLNKLPILRSVYPSIKQVTDFLVGEKDEMQFSRVVAVEYPRKGIWSLGLVTGETMRTIQDAAGSQCMTVFIPSSPTPFTGYVLTVPRKDTVDLPISIDDALRFTISGGVVVPNNQLINPQLAAGELAKIESNLSSTSGAATDADTKNPGGDSESTADKNASSDSDD